MSPRATVLSSALSIVLAYGGAHSVGACAPEARAAPRYEGPAPSQAWQSVLRSLGGKQLPDTKLGSPGSDLVVEAFFIGQNPLTGLGPIVTLVTPEAIGQPFDVSAPQGSGGRWVLPVITDGDAADLVRRVTGHSSGDALGETSAIYRNTIDGL